MLAACSFAGAFLHAGKQEQVSFILLPNNNTVRLYFKGNITSLPNKSPFIYLFPFPEDRGASISVPILLSR
jgi:hypothetical protein